MRPNLERLSHLSTIGTVLVAVLALAIAVWQIRAAEKVQREATAREAFKEYLKIAIDKPELADARITPQSNENSRNAYAWFVTYFLYSAEQVLESYPDDPGWRAGLAEEACYHRAYLSAAGMQGDLQAQHSPEFAAFIIDSLKHCPEP